eukprot:TRINITY_DN19261_c0_g1_i2.p2 TRINITY_DN19261_c0_g1~~TRINITY_DN19261_c0_g1_i2.p2  ORF type:complete len:122 (+),score=2.34 TRINITY_DN19261_c0_g1_i2:232-597(+)
MILLLLRNPCAGRGGCRLRLDSDPRRDNLLPIRRSCCYCQPNQLQTSFQLASSIHPLKLINLRSHLKEGYLVFRLIANTNLRTKNLYLIPIPINKLQNLILAVTGLLFNRDAQTTNGEQRG